MENTNKLTSISNVTTDRHLFRKLIIDFITSYANAALSFLTTRKWICSYLFIESRSVWLTSRRSSWKEFSLVHQWREVSIGNTMTRLRTVVVIPSVIKMVKLIKFCDFFPPFHFRMETKMLKVSTMPLVKWCQHPTDVRWAREKFGSSGRMTRNSIPIVWVTRAKWIWKLLMLVFKWLNNLAFTLFYFFFGKLKNKRVEKIRIGYREGIGRALILACIILGIHLFTAFFFPL